MRKIKEKEIVIHYNWKSITTIILGALFALSLFVLLSSLTLQQTVINPQYYKDNLKAVNAYNRIINQGIPSLILETHISDNSLTDTLAKEISIFLIQRFVDPMWVEDLTNRFIDNSVIFLADRNKNIELNLASTKSVLNNISQALVIADQFIPSCKAEKKTNNTVTLALFDISYLCKEKGVDLDEIKKDLQAIQSEIKTINVGVVELDSTVNQINAGIAKIRSLVENIYIYLIGSLICLLILAGFMVGLYWDDRIKMLRSLSISCAIGSFMALITALIMNLAASKQIGYSIALSDSMRSIINDFLNVTISGVFNRLEAYSLIVLVVSVGVYILSHLKHKHS